MRYEPQPIRYMVLDVARQEIRRFVSPTLSVTDVFSFLSISPLLSCDYRESKIDCSNGELLIIEDLFRGVYIYVDVYFFFTKIKIILSKSEREKN